MILRIIGHLIDEDLARNIRHFQVMGKSLKYNYATQNIKRIIDQYGLQKHHLPQHSIDLVYSYNVFEHIPLDEIKFIFQVLDFCLALDGKIILYIDFSNHDSPLQDPFGHILKQRINPSENGLGFSLIDFLNCIDPDIFTYTIHDILSAKDQFKSFKESSRLQSSHNGELAALIEVTRKS